MPTHPPQRPLTTGVTPPRPTSSTVKWGCKIRVDKFHGDDLAAPYESRVMDGNLLMYKGASMMWGSLIGEATTDPFDNTNAAIGVGDSDTASLPTMTDLQGSNKKLVGMDTGFPEWVDDSDSSAASAIWQATFTTTDANFEWKEIGLFNATSSGDMLQRRVGGWGTKTSSDTWTVTIVLTLA